MKLPVHRIIPFSNVEGAGNRTSIFVQGCNLNCKYCHNSETIPIQSPDTMFFSVEQLVEEVKKNMPFIRGITVSGGEATLYYRFLTSFFREIKKLGLTTYIDSNGFFDRIKIGDLIEVTDKFLFDIKGDVLSLSWLCFENAKDRLANPELNMENMEYLLKRDKIEEVRLVYLKQTFDDEVLIERIGRQLKPYPEVLFKLIRVHVRGLPAERVESIKQRIPSRREMEQIADLAKQKGIQNLVTIM